MSPEDQAEKEPAGLAESRMTLGEHLSELRTRLFRGVLTIVVIFGVAWTFEETVTEFAQGPYTQAMTRLEPEFVQKSEAVLKANPGLKRSDFFESGSTAEDPVLRDFRKRLTIIEPFEGFVYKLKICFYAAMVLGSPVLLWQMWQFIAAGLYAKEKRAILRYFPLSLAAFGAGISFGFLVVVPQGLYYINQSVSVKLGIPNTSASTYLSFLSSLCLAFGFIFQLPLVMTFLGSMGIVDHRILAKYRGEFLISAFVLAAFLTPPEPFTQVMMGLPMVLLYEAGIIGARIAGRRREQAEAAEVD